jgi:hypothetical protein
MVGSIFLHLCRRTLTAAGILALAWWVMGTAPLLATAPGLASSTPQFTVNQFRKGDRVRMTRTPPVRHDLHMPQSLQSGKILPLGCDPALGPIAAESIYGRCMV